MSHISEGFLRPVAGRRCVGPEHLARGCMSTRDLDIVLFGATGFTGTLVAQALLSTDEVRTGGARVALAGRSKTKLEAVLRNLDVDDDIRARTELVVVDAADVPALKALAARTKVVCTTVGPYLEHGLPLVAACAENGTHYCDLTGEPPFIRRSIDNNGEAARTSGARIVHCCGFDSIPSDLGTLLLQQAAIDDGGPCQKVVYTLGRVKGGFSGGTAHSMLGIFEAASKDKAVRKTMSDPYSLVPDGKRGSDRGDRFSVHHDADVDGFVGPFLMGPINTRIVRRTNHMLEQRYGDDFSYGEQHRFGRGVKGRLIANGVRAGLVATMGVGSNKAGRALLGRVFPAPGEGPSKEERESGFFEGHFHGRRDDGAHFSAFVRGEKDPGYAGTAIMLSQAALSLAFDTLGAPGVTTPAAALGMPLVERLRRQGMTFTAQRVS